jgi:hypothetical protein
LRAAAAATTGDPFVVPSSRNPPKDGIDLFKLERELSRIDIATIQKRRAIYNRLVQEALHTSTLEVIPGLNFTSTLLMIAHNKLVLGEEALS